MTGIPTILLAGPIIICGMHRSGTSILAQCLEVMGLDICRPVNGHYESELFLKINRRLMDLAHARWDQPRGCADMIEQMTDDDWGYIKLELLQWLEGRIRSGVWGFKDPRSTVLLPIWTRFYPDAKVLFIYRDKEPVVKSLVSRETKRAWGAREMSFRCRHPHSAGELWNEYMHAWELFRSNEYALSGLIRTGVGNPGGKCSKCPLAQFGSAGRGQACAEKRILFLLLPDRVLPVAVQIPPTSVRAVKKYRLRMTTFGLPWWAVVTGMRLESKRNNDGQEYSVVALETLARLTPTEQAKIEEYQAGIVPALEQAAHVMAQDSPGIDEEAPF